MDNGVYPTWNLVVMRSDVSHLCLGQNSCCQHMSTDDGHCSNPLMSRGKSNLFSASCLRKRVLCKCWWWPDSGRRFGNIFRLQLSWCRSSYVILLLVVVVSTLANLNYLNFVPLFAHQFFCFFFFEMRAYMHVCLSCIFICIQRLSVGAPFFPFQINRLPSEANRQAKENWCRK